MSVDTRPVRFVCTDENQHALRVVATLRLTSASVEHVSTVRTTAPFNRPAEDQLRRRRRIAEGLSTLPDFDLLCSNSSCRRNIRHNAAGMRAVLEGLLRVHVGESAMVLDISGPIGRMIG